MNAVTLQERVRELVEQHDNLRKAARAIQVEPSYLQRLGNGEKVNPSADVLRKLGLRRVVTYELHFDRRVAPATKAAGKLTRAEAFKRG